jgi:biotin-dependent carboxylase-like uncharacterized protein
MHSVQVIKPGYYDSIQDPGRFGMSALGIPVSGVMDEVSAQIANALLRNKKNAPVLEMSLMGPTLMFQKSAIIAIAGADMTPTLNGLSVKMQTKLHVKTGDILTFGKAIYGSRCYLAVKNGFKTEFKLHSHASYKGITTLVKLEKGVVLPIGKQFELISLSNAHLKVNNQLFTSDVIEVYQGPEYDLLNAKQKDYIAQNAFQIIKNSRMGYQLKAVAALKHAHDILTSSVMPGTVQLTSGGQLIVLMKDCQTTGGYPRVLQLSSDALAILAQKNISQKITFKIIHL